MNPLSSRPLSRRLYVLVRTWDRDSHGLYDYESEHVTTSGFETCVYGRLCRVGDKVQFVRESDEEEELIAVEPEGTASEHQARLRRRIYGSL